jgi:hypothetical protein
MYNAAGNTPAFYTLPMAEAHAIEITAWRYPPPYEQYNLATWEQMKAGGRQRPRHSRL